MTKSKEVDKMETEKKNNYKVEYKKKFTHNKMVKS